MAVKVPAIASPLASVVTPIEFVPFEKVPLAPEAGAVKVNAIPGTGFPALSKTYTPNGEPKAVFKFAPWAGSPRMCTVSAAPGALYS